MSVEGWTKVAIEDCCEILDGKRVPISAEEREKRIGNVPYYGANGLQGYIDDHIFDEDLILIAEDGGYFNEFSTRPIAYKISGKSWVNNHAHVLKAKHGYYQDIIFYLLEHKDIQPFIVGGTRAKLNQSELRSIEFWMPECGEEQRQIAAVLSTIDRAIEQTEATIAKQQRIKTGLMQDLLTKGIDESGNIRSEETHEFKDSAIGRIPVEWDVSNLDSVCSRITDGVHQQVKTTESGIPFLYVSCVREGVILWNRAARIDSRTYEQISKGCEPKKGVILYTVVGSYGHAAVIETDVKFSFQRHIAYILPNEEILDPSYLMEWMNSSKIKNYADQAALGNAQKTITLGALREFPVLRPGKDEQLKISRLLASQSKSLNKYYAVLDKLKTQKTGLMQDLLTGKVCVTPLLDRPST